MAKPIMIQGTMSNVGKSVITAGLCRIFMQDGWRVAPFKSQNMALNSYITEEGLEMGRAQVMQAEAAGIRPSVLMNPILLKPVNDTGSQVILHGEVLGNQSAREYFACKQKMIPEILKAYRKLEQQADIIVIEGAGSPAEINLKQNDIVNMGIAELVDAPVLLVGDIDRGGVFAQLFGTLMLLEQKECSRVKGLIINKFRGDKSILEPGLWQLEEKSGKHVLGVVPYLKLSLEEEDSLSERLKNRAVDLIDIAVIRFPRLSNFTDFSVFERIPGVSVRYVDAPGKLQQPDMIILPGSKNTIADLKWMRSSGLEAAVKKQAEHCVLFGVCGGFQMLGTQIADPERTEEGGTVRGMELLPMETVLWSRKIRTRVNGRFQKVEGILSRLSGMELSGYEIHMGKSRPERETPPLVWLENRLEQMGQTDGLQEQNIYGSYVHGIFDKGNIAETIVQALAQKKGITLEHTLEMDYESFKEQQYDRLADALREHLDMERIYRILEKGAWL